MTWLARLSLTNRAIVGLVTVLVIVFGVSSTTSIRQELFPSLDVPVASVVTPYPGASPDLVEQQVTTPLEAAIDGIEGITDTRSTSSGGTSVITLDLEYGSDLDELTSRVQRAVQGVRLPADVTPQVLTGSTDSLPIVALAVSSQLGDDQVAAILRDQVRPLLAGLDGVGDVTLSGIRDPRITIDVDTAEAARRGVSLSAISTLLQSNGVRVPAGQLTPDTDPLTVEVGSPIASVEQLRDLYVGSGAAVPPAAPPGAAAAPGGGAPVRLGDIATVTAEPAPATGYTRTGGIPSIGVGVTKQADANTVAVSDEVRDVLPRIAGLLGGDAEDAQVTVVFDQAPYIQQSVDDLTTEGLLGLLFAVLVILGFLLSVRATLVTAVSIPLSVLIAMIVLDLGGYTLNILTLGALTVAIGRVVDDSIVVIENIKRHIGHGGPRRAAILTAIREVAGAITASTITTVAVFAPIGLVGGQVGELFRPFAVTVTAALLASLVVSLTVVPVLASMVLRSPATPAAEPPAAGEPTEETAERSRLQAGYLPVLRAALGRPVVSLVIAVAILLGTLALVPQLRTNFLGDAGGDTLSVSQEMPPGTGLPAADVAAKKVEAVLAETAGVQSYQVTVGSPAGGAGGFGPPPGLTSATATRFSVTLDEDGDATAVQDDLRARLDGLGDPAEVGTLSVEAGQGGFGNELQVVVRAEDPAVLARAADQVQHAVTRIPDATDVRNNLAAAQPGVNVAVDRRRAAEAGLTEAQIGQSVATALRGSTVGTLTIDGVEQSVVLRTGSAPADLASLRALPLPGPRGTIPLRDVATVSQTSTPPSISHTDGGRSALITARPAVDDLGAVTAALQDTLDGLALPAGATAELGGVSAQQDEAFAQLGLALLVAIAVVYLVMVVTFRSLLQPLLLLVSIPFAATGALGLLLVTGTPLGVPALIGMLMLVGIVVTNAIVLIDLVNQYRRAGRGVMAAVVEGSAQRLRPILMTAVATICALLPMALGLTGGGVFISQPLAIVVIGGLISSTLLTLVLVPVLYLLTERARARWGRGGASPADAGPDTAGTAVNPGVSPNGAAAGAADREPVRVGSAAVPVAAGSAAAATSSADAWSGGGAASPAAPVAAALPEPPVAAPPPAPEPPDGPGVYGLLADRDDVPLAGAALSVFDTVGTQLAATTSDEHGRYRAALPGPGEYLLVGQTGGREPVAEWVVLSPPPGAPTARHDLRIEGPASLVGVVRSASGAGVAAFVTLVDRHGEVVAGTRTGADGRYRLAHVPAGDHHLLFSPPSGESATQRIELPATGRVPCDVVLAPTGGLTGTVRSERGREVSDAVTTLVDTSGVVVASGRTGPDGTFRLFGIPEGDYTLTANAGTPAVRSVRVSADEITGTDLVLGAAPADAEQVAPGRHRNGHGS
ncbi:efflux RND transporter permease subunit [Pseudonocardia sp. H11422]|uniref:efflux RND transporter permease subunit n=1 Tax=Pseudonocardia sp. H11422 TaxID=2835866 RepID=UPI001BDD6497|nr:efflux RND transporter permease subunit [Pseudonocardia sp. H11422]